MKNYSKNSKIKSQPAETKEMDQEPVAYEQKSFFLGSNLKGKVAIITGGDSGIGQSVAFLYAQHGINSVIVYYDEEKDAQHTVETIKTYGVEAESLKGDISDRSFCKAVVEFTKKRFGRIDILINNASVQYPQEELTNISEAQLLQTFSVNVFGMFYLTQSALKYLEKGSSIINTTSVTAFRGSEHLVDYAATKAAIVGFTRSLALQLGDKGIRVNAVAPGPIWTPLIPASFDKEKVEEFGKDTLLGREGQPYEVAPSYLFLVLEENSYMTGQVLHPNGGEIVA
jgi:NAD(P)-dependent dehydrogenase (short-subunit alcohol dehydrogenase family)